MLIITVQDKKEMVIKVLLLAHRGWCRSQSQKYQIYTVVTWLFCVVLNVERSHTSYSAGCIGRYYQLFLFVKYQEK